MSAISTFIICLMMVIIAIVSGVYNEMGYIARIITIIIAEAIIGTMGKLIWESYNIPYLAIVISTILVTLLSSFLFGKENGELVGKIFLIIMIGAIFYTGVEPMTTNKKNYKMEQNEIESQPKEDEKTLIENSKILSPAETAKLSGETTDLSEEEIREIKTPVLIDGYKVYYQNQFPDVYWYGGDGKALPSNGCSITSMAIILNNFGINVSPEDIVNYVNSLPDNYHKDEGGARYVIFEELSDYYELPGKCIPQLPKEDTDQVVKCLKNGGMVISLQDEGEFTRYGHYIVICDYNEESNSIVVLDPNINNMYRERERGYRYTMEEIEDACVSWWLFYPKGASNEV